MTKEKENVELYLYLLMSQRWEKQRKENGENERLNTKLNKKRKKKKNENNKDGARTSQELENIVQKKKKQ